MRRDVLILGLAIAAQAFAAQAPAVEAPEEPLKLSVTAELVLLDVSVKDKAGEHVSNLSKSNFSIYEDGTLRRSRILRATTCRSRLDWLSTRAEACARSTER